MCLEETVEELARVRIVVIPSHVVGNSLSHDVGHQFLFSLQLDDPSIVRALKELLELHPEGMCRSSKYLPRELEEMVVLCMDLLEVEPEISLITPEQWTLRTMPKCSHDV